MVTLKAAAMWQAAIWQAAKLVEVSPADYDTDSNCQRVLSAAITNKLHRDAKDTLSCCSDIDTVQRDTQIRTQRALQHKRYKTQVRRQKADRGQRGQRGQRRKKKEESAHNTMHNAQMINTRNKSATATTTTNQTN